MGSQGHSDDILVVYAQVGTAKANHRVESDTGFLRPKSYRLPSKVVYLGDVAANALAYLENPETPRFTEPPQFNEQRWTFKTQSGGLELTISSKSYWGFGLFNSSYLNRLELKGPPQSYARLLFDLSASLGHRPWEFSHPSSAEKFLTKQDGDITLKSNERLWKRAFEMAKSIFEEQMFMIEEKEKAVVKRVKKAVDSKEWTVARAESLIEDAQYDLQVAKGALADGNAPGFERALARAEASFIEADPQEVGRMFDDDVYKSPQGQVLDNKMLDSEVMLVDLTTNTEEE